MQNEPTAIEAEQTGQPAGDPPAPREGTQRPARPGETCTCGRPAVTMIATKRGEVGHCGRSDGGRRG